MKTKFLSPGPWPVLALAVVFLIPAPAWNGPSASAADPQDLVLFTACGAEKVLKPAAGGAIRQRPVQINPAVGKADGVRLGDRLWVTPFADQTYVAVIDLAETNVNGVRAVRGRVEAWDGATVLLSSREGRTLGTLNIPSQGRQFDICPADSSGEHWVLEVDRGNRDLLPDAAPLRPPFEEAASLQAPQSPAAPSAVAGQTRLDIMVVYTAAARDWAASRGGIELIISQDIQNDVLALQNSGLNMTARLVHSALVDYAESGDSGTDLTRLKDTADGDMDDVHKWRNTYGADLVQLLALADDTGGIGYLLNMTSGLPTYAFTLVRVQQAGWSYTSIHEIGHNLGCHHRKDQAVQPGPGLFSYSAGWRWIGSDGNRYCSIMSYPDSWDGQPVAQTPYFSSPLIYYMGAATGDAVNADNARTIRQSGPVVAAYRKKQGAIR